MNSGGPGRTDVTVLDFAHPTPKAVTRSGGSIQNFINEAFSDARGQSTLNRVCDCGSSSCPRRPDATSRPSTHRAGGVDCRDLP